ncbi:MAG TPA: class II aldolase/adducin family protein [Candidatus Polarisedimenticolia bacterium]|nr:class II aldolase/adducin family protein [Candidatus Polarisedimenticolia bacterium]
MYPDSISHGAMKTEHEHRRDICAVGRWVHDRGYVASTDGNVSVRLGASHILTSPTCISKGMMKPEDLVITDLAGRRVSGSRNASSELAMHLLIYRLRPDVNAVCHAHPPVATGYAAAGMALDKPILCELVIGLGSVPVASYGTPGTPELTEALEPLIHGHDAILMANHGVVTYGPDLLTAFLRMETAEHFARVALVTELLGKQKLLSHSDVEKLLAARARYGAGAHVAPQDSGYPGRSEGPDAERVTLTRGELDALIDEAIQKDRTRR